MPRITGTLWRESNNGLWIRSKNTSKAKNVLMPCSLHDSAHHSDVIISMMASRITSLTIVYSTVYPSVDEIKHQISASLAFVRGIHRWPVNSPHKWPVTRKMFPFDDVIMDCYVLLWSLCFVLRGWWDSPFASWFFHGKNKNVSTINIILHTDIRQVVEILPHVKQQPNYTIW